MFSAPMFIKQRTLITRHGPSRTQLPSSINKMFGYILKINWILFKNRTNRETTQGKCAEVGLNLLPSSISVTARKRVLRFECECKKSQNAFTCFYRQHGQSLSTNNCISARRYHQRRAS